MVSASSRQEPWGDLSVQNHYATEGSLHLFAKVFLLEIFPN